jgi:hypothetical protein
MRSFQEWITESIHKLFYWANAQEFPLGTVITAGDFIPSVADAENNPDAYKMWPLWKAQERAFERIRSEKFPHRPSRIVAIFLTDNPKDGNMWKVLRLHSHLYQVEVISGEPYLTDAGTWSDAHHYVSKPWAYSNNTATSVAQSLDNGTHGMQNLVHGTIHSYWNRDPEESLDTPEYILGKGGKIRITKMVI